MQEIRIILEKFYKKILDKILSDVWKISEKIFFRSKRRSPKRVLSTQANWPIALFLQFEFVGNRSSIPIPSGRDTSGLFLKVFRPFPVTGIHTEHALYFLHKDALIVLLCSTYCRQVCPVRSRINNPLCFLSSRLHPNWVPQGKLIKIYDRVGYRFSKRGKMYSEGNMVAFYGGKWYEYLSWGLQGAVIT